MSEVWISISELNKVLNLTLEECLPAVKFEGEISELTCAGSGHWYLTLKDETAEIRAVVWAGTARGIRFRPAVGMTVRCVGRPNVYHKNGRLQMVVSRMEQAGEGALQKKFFELKSRLEKEGLFEQARKRKLPFLPKAIGLITSAQGAALHDIMVRLNERAPQIPKFLVDVRVQGPCAAEDIAQALDYLGGSGLVDVIICGRGGGSLEDLWAFNEEVTVRAFFACKVPVISAVGHEVDISLSDLAADVRAPTPTAAAEMVAPRRSDLLQTITDFERRLSDFNRWLAPMSQALDDLAGKLSFLMDNRLKSARLALGRAEAALKILEPLNVIRIERGKVTSLFERLLGGVQKAVSEKHRGLLKATMRLESVSPERKLIELGGRVEAYYHRLEALNPIKVLGRGYSIVKSGEKVIRSSDEVKEGDRLSVTLASGALGARVEEKF